MKKAKKEDMKKEKAPAMGSPFHGNMITVSFNNAKEKGYIRGHIRLKNIPPNAN